MASNVTIVMTEGRIVHDGNSGIEGEGVGFEDGSWVGDMLDVGACVGDRVGEGDGADVGDGLGDSEVVGVGDGVGLNKAVEILTGDTSG